MSSDELDIFSYTPLNRENCFNDIFLSQRAKLKKKQRRTPLGKLSLSQKRKSIKGPSKNNKATKIKDESCITDAKKETPLPKIDSSYNHTASPIILDLSSDDSIISAGVSDVTNLSQKPSSLPKSPMHSSVSASVLGDLPPHDPGLPSPLPSSSSHDFDLSSDSICNSESLLRTLATPQSFREDNNLGYHSLSKVNSWLHHVKNNFLPEDNEESSKNQKIDIPDSPTKTCLHIHLHLRNSDKKVIQPTIDTYFAKETCQESVKIDKDLSKPQNLNNNNAIKAWKDIFNTEKKKCSSQEIFTQTSKKESQENLPTQNRTCPFYKIIEDCPFVVDAFSYGNINGISAYFLTHFHSDHFKGLTKNFNKQIYCSKITANLVSLTLKVPSQYINVLPLNESCIIKGVEVTLYDANHCPGSVMFVFRLTSGKSILHVGDFRADSKMGSFVRSWCGKFDILYLDTTYLSPEYDFEAQENVLVKVKQIAKDHANKDSKTIFLVGSYTIGKEKVFMAIANALGCKIFCNAQKMAILKCLEDDEITRCLTTNKESARIHIRSMHELGSPLKVHKYLDQLNLQLHSTVVIIKPTGWSHNTSLRNGLREIKPRVVGKLYFYDIPYSEHSSYSELESFVRGITPKRVIPTVNVGSHESRRRMKTIIDSWLSS